MRTLILAHGDAPSEETARRLARTHDLLIATDGAIHNADRLGISPQVLVGDLDSVRLDAMLAAHPGLRVSETPDQDSSDLEKAVSAAIELGAKSVTIIGATGGRLDHTLANLAILLRTDVDICLADDFGIVRALDSGDAGNTLNLETAPGDTVSLITFDPDTIVSIEGAMWPLAKFHLRPGTRGVSNVAKEDAVYVTVHCGRLFVCHLYAQAIRLHSHHQKASSEQM